MWKELSKYFVTMLFEIMSTLYLCPNRQLHDAYTPTCTVHANYPLPPLRVQIYHSQWIFGPGAHTTIINPDTPFKTAHLSHYNTISGTTGNRRTYRHASQLRAIRWNGQRTFALTERMDLFASDELGVVMCDHRNENFKVFKTTLAENQCNVIFC